MKRETFLINEESCLSSFYQPYSMGPGIHVEFLWQVKPKQTLFHTKYTSEWRRHSLMASMDWHMA